MNSKYDEQKLGDQDLQCIGKGLGVDVCGESVLDVWRNVLPSEEKSTRIRYKQEQRIRFDSDMYTIHHR